MVSFKQYLTEGALQKSNLNANPGRLDNLIKKLTNKEPFVLKGSTIPSLIIEPDLFWLEDLKLTKQLKTDYILDVNGQKIPLSTLQKTAEFGSSGRVGTEKESVQLNRLGQLIKELGEGEPIDIKIGKKIYKNCIDVKNTPGTPKSDFEVIDQSGKSVIFISHKDGNSPKGFKQWSGITDYINDYPEIQKFAQDVKTILKKEHSYNKNKELVMISGTFKRKIKSSSLKLKACFGKEFGEIGFGINNVTCILQGTVELKSKNNYFELTAEKLWLNGDTPKGEYDPVLVVYKGGGPQRFDQQVRNARFSIYPSEGRGGKDI